MKKGDVVRIRMDVTLTIMPLSNLTGIVIDTSYSTANVEFHQPRVFRQWFYNMELEELPPREAALYLAERVFNLSATGDET